MWISRMFLGMFPQSLQATCLEPKSTCEPIASSCCNIPISLTTGVEVGDFSFGERNYNGALMRYKNALEEKPGDIAIHVRLGRVHEKLGQLPLAIEAYDAAKKLPRTEKWTDEAKAA